MSEWTHRSPDGGDPPVDRREPGEVGELLAALDGLIGANTRLRAQLETNEQILHQAHAMVARGVSITDTLRVVPSLTQRKAAEEAVTDLFDVWLRLRRAVVCSSVADGIPVERIASMLEVSVQLVCALAAASPDLRNV